MYVSFFKNNKHYWRNMKYDPVKNIFAKLIHHNKLFRKVFYLILDITILRQLYVKKSIKKYYQKTEPFTFYDAGAGFCQYTDFILNHFPKADIVSMDLKTDYMLSYQSSLPSNCKRIKIYQGDLQSFICPQKTDLVIAIDILEHIQDDISVLKNIYQTMNHEGKLIISTPSNLDKAAAFTEEHVRPGYSMLELENKLKKTGFKILEIYYSYGFWGKLYWNIGMKIPLSLLSLSKLFFMILPLYFIIVVPFNLIFMFLDMNLKNKKGNGIVCISKKI